MGLHLLSHPALVVITKKGAEAEESSHSLGRGDILGQ
jgi:hypothetical protein